ncbi:DNA internalization-related competence protein ComEC/Rec2 [Desulfatirhabdium butyrativorans]|uniref:DNA internalization-related competence protein ComEC/Rec2 n=1 Tax=Desulfatirhabdium butyrativorans TaxID=340467 RepID=UPI0009FEF121|nr:DNA internalization-related competence protein ComEC/Rec2 [Desulfatirhabdium butyrativorans]
MSFPEGRRRTAPNGALPFRCYDRPMVALLLAFASGIAVCDAWPDHILEAILAGFAAGAWMAYGLFRGRPLAFSPLAVFAALGYLAIQPWASASFPESHFLHRIAETPGTIVGTVTDTDETVHGRTRLRLKLDQVNDHAVSGNIRLTVEGDCPLVSGDRIRFFAKLYPVRTHHNPGGFDVARSLRFSGIDGTAFVRPEAVSLEASHPPILARMLQKDRGLLAARMDEADGSADARGILKAVLLGIRNGVSPETTDYFARTGLGHLLAISGLHVGIVAASAYFVFYRLLAFVKPLLMRAWARKAAALLSLIPVAYYGLLSGMSPSTQRAILMVVLVVAGSLFERDHDGFNTLALAAWGILIVHPPALFAISFQLSFASVLAILAGMALVLPRMAKPLRWRDHLLLPILVSACATAGTLPLVMYHFQRVSLVSLAANACIVPIMSLLVIPVGLFGAALHFLHLPGVQWCFDLACGILDRVLDVVRWFAAIPSASIVTFKPTIVEIAWYAALCWMTARYIAVQSADETQTGGNSDHPIALCHDAGRFAIDPRTRWAWLLIAVIALADAGWWINERYWHPELRVSVLDVGQGLSILVEEPKGRVMLIDGGGLPDPSLFDVGKRIVTPALCAKKILSLDRVVLTHPDSDHLNGLLYILKHFAIREVWTNGRPIDEPNYREFLQILRERSIPLIEGDAIPRHIWEAGLQLSLLHPEAAFAPPLNPKKRRDTNNFSLVISLRMGEIGFLFPADIEAPAETWLLEHGPGRLKSTVLVAPHHGSKTSSTPAFIDAVRPDVVIFSAGNNRFIPHPDVLARYRQAGCRLVSTAQAGAVSMTTDGRRLFLSVFKPDSLNEEIAIDGDI